MVPDLFQTEEYADQAIRLSPGMRSEPEIRRLVELRMRRWQSVVSRGSHVWAIFDETVLWHQLGNAAIMHGQIRHLISISDQENVTIQIIPAITLMQATVSYPITLLRFREAFMPDVVYLEQLTTALYMDKPDDVSRYTQVLSALGMEALTPEETTDYLTQLLMDI